MTLRRRLAALETAARHPADPKPYSWEAVLRVGWNCRPTAEHYREAARFIRDHPELVDEARNRRGSD
jgi:hypothetical protein